MCAPRSRRGVISGRGGTVLCLNSVRVVMRGRWSLTGNDIALRCTVMIQVVIYLSCFVLRFKLFIYLSYIYLSYFVLRSKLLCISTTIYVISMRHHAPPFWLVRKKYNIQIDDLRLSLENLFILKVDLTVKVKEKEINDEVRRAQKKIRGC